MILENFLKDFILKFFLLGYGCLFLSGSEFLFSQAVQKKDSTSIMIDVDKRQMSVGSIITVAIKLFLPKGFRLISWKESLSEGWSLKDFVSYKKQKWENDKFLFRYDYRLTTYRLGKRKIDSFSFKIESPDGKKETLKSKPVQVDVISVIKKENLKGIIQEPLSFLPPQKISLWLILLFVGFGAFFVMMIYFVKRYLARRKKTIIVQEKMVIPEDQKAIESLDGINFSLFKTQKDFYGRVSFILRDYLEHRFDCHAQESTSTELMVLIKGYVSREVLRSIKNFSSEADLVKFAKKQIDDDVSSKIVNQVKWIVLKTKRKPYFQENQ